MTSQAASTASGTATHTATEVVAGRVYLLGGTTPIAGNFTWRDPSHDGREESFNAYLVLGEGQAVLVETGVTLHRQALLEQLATTLDGRRLAAVVGTRLEPECFANLPVLVDPDAGRTVDVYAPGGLNPLDFFDDLMTEELMKHFGVEVILLRDGTRIPVAADDELEVTVPALRTLSTGWIYDPRSATLFSSDTWSHFSATSATRRVVGEGAEPAEPHTGEPLQAYVSRHHLTKFDWLRRADVSLMISEIEELFATHPVRALAPTRGCVIRGEQAVRDNVDAVLGMLRDIMAAHPATTAAEEEAR